MPAPFDPALVDNLAGVLRPIRSQTRSALPGTRTEELTAYGILSVVAARLARDEAVSIEELSPELAAFARGPFVGFAQPS